MQYKIVGAMSGTSLDGLDLVLVNFQKIDEQWQFSVEKADTITYPKELVDKLKMAIDQEKEEVQALDLILGKFIGQGIKEFLGDNKSVDFVASHGHTIFHQPEKGVTVQIGNGEQITKNCGVPVINNFRSLDVSLGGQGAPLVPIGDRDLFPEFTYCLNLGGIANISYQSDGNRVAFDICPFNMALNELANEKGLDFDDRGQLAGQGIVNQDLLFALNEIPYLSQASPKSLGLEDYRKFWLPIITSSYLSVEDRMCTFSEHAAIQVAKSMRSTASEKVLITGGGTFHDYFISRIQALSMATICIPDTEIINFKEAVVFAYLGLLRHLEQPNSLCSVTGASRNSSGGDLYGF